MELEEALAYVMSGDLGLNEEKFDESEEFELNCAEQS